MKESLVSRLRGKYEVGDPPLVVARPPICLEAANRIEALEAELRFLVDNDSVNDSSIDREIELLLNS